MPLPPLPDWAGLHPLVVHFPIALLLVVPVFLLLAIATYRRTPSMALAALLLMVLGSIAAFVTVSTGKAAGELVDLTDEIQPVLSEHRELAETARNIFTGLTVLYAAVVFTPLYLPRLRRPAVLYPTHSVFLALYLGACLLLINAAHDGGRLVHEFGVHAMM